MRTIDWVDEKLHILDQRRLPWAVAYVDYEDYREVAQVITDEALGGSSPTSVAAAYGMALAARQSPAMDMGSLLEFLEIATLILKKARPASVGLNQVVDRMMTVARADIYPTVKEIKAALLNEAHLITSEEVTAHRLIGKYGAALVRSGQTILYHAGSHPLSGVEYGGAAAIINVAHETGRRIRVLVPEGRPMLYSARLLGWQLSQIGVPFEIITDAAAGYLMRRGEIDLVLVDAERVAVNGDTIGYTGGYPLAVLARDNNKPFYVVAPLKLVDPELINGEQFTQEPGAPAQLRGFDSNPILPDTFPVRHLVYDVTYQRYLAGIVTEVGILSPPFRETLPKALGATVHQE